MSTLKIWFPMRRKLALLALLIAAPVQLVAQANPMNLVETMIASGFLNGVPFDNMALTITASYDPSTVYQDGAHLVVHAPLTYTVSGLGSFTDVGLPDYIVSTGAGLGVGSQTYQDLLTSANATLNSYTLAAPMGPVMGSGISAVPGRLHHTGAKADTTAGLFELDRTTRVTILFYAGTPLVPSEPAIGSPVAPPVAPPTAPPGPPADTPTPPADTPTPPAYTPPVASAPPPWHPPICDSAASARARNSPAAPTLERQCSEAIAASGPRVRQSIPVRPVRTVIPICDSARSARARNSGATANLEAQCRAAGGDPNYPGGVAPR